MERAQAAVLYNLAAVQCQQAVAADRSSDDGIKLACHLFQMAAGACAHLRDGVGLKVRLRFFEQGLKPCARANARSGEGSAVCRAGCCRRLPAHVPTSAGKSFVSARSSAGSALSARTSGVTSLLCACPERGAC